MTVLEGLGYTFTGIEWVTSGNALPSLLDEADALHALLMLRADKLANRTEGSEEETELALISETVDAYEAKRWPGGKVDGGKG